MKLLMKKLIITIILSILGVMMAGTLWIYFKSNFITGYIGGGLSVLIFILLYDILSKVQ